AAASARATTAAAPRPARPATTAARPCAPDGPGPGPPRGPAQNRALLRPDVPPGPHRLRAAYRTAATWERPEGSRAGAPGGPRSVRASPRRRRRARPGPDDAPRWRSAP